MNFLINPFKIISKLLNIQVNGGLIQTFMPIIIRFGAVIALLRTESHNIRIPS